MGKADSHEHTCGCLVGPSWGPSQGNESLFAEGCLSPGRAGWVPYYRPKSILGLLCWSG